MRVVQAFHPHPDLADRFLYCEDAANLLFTDNETNRQRIYGTANPTLNDSFKQANNLPIRINRRTGLQASFRSRKDLRESFFSQPASVGNQWH